MVYVSFMLARLILYINVNPATTDVVLGITNLGEQIHSQWVYPLVIADGGLFTALSTPSYVCDTLSRGLWLVLISTVRRQQATFVPAAAASSTSSAPATSSTTPSHSKQYLFGQCGGKSWHGPTECYWPGVCFQWTPAYSQCV